jgi:hypothetical protein
MPITFDIDMTNDLTVFIWSGEITYIELVDTLNCYGKNKPAIYELHDLRNLTGDRLSSDELHTLSVYLEQHTDSRPLNSKTAVVVKKSLDYGLSRMISSLTDQRVHYEIEVFRTLSDAKQWLNEL